MTDTFQLGESDGKDQLFSEMFLQNSERVEKQKKAPIRVIVGNPPYSVGQQSANDNAGNQKYEVLENRIGNTYSALSTATNRGALYDAYIKAFRWSTDRLDENGGIICFISNGAWLDGNSTDGFRLALEKEFSSIYVFNLRGNQRTSGELSRKEGGKFFGSGSRTPIAITLLVKNPRVKTDKATIHYRDIGDYLSREEKLKIVKDSKAFSNPEMEMKKISPNVQGDWISMRNDSFENFISIGDKKGGDKIKSFFVPYYSNGVKTNRDAWVYNFDKNVLSENMKETIRLYNKGLKCFKEKSVGQNNPKADDFIDFSQKMISWTREIKWDIEKGKSYDFEPDSLRYGLYRPFVKQHLYFNSGWNNMQYQIPKLFPKKDSINRVICLPAPGGRKEFAVIISEMTPDIHLNGDNQCFPLYYYEANKNAQKGLFDQNTDQDYIKRDAISNFILERAVKQYGKSVTTEDIFYYVYGFLHSPEYRETFANDLKKMLPKLPLVDEPKVFWQFSKAGRELADLHLNYEKVPPSNEVIVTGAEKLAFIDEEPKDTKLFIVDKMRFPKKNQKDTILYNGKITISNIPLEAYEYVVNGKPAIEWIMERYQVSTHKDSGIVNDPNDWAKESENPRYILDLLLSVITVSVKTNEIVSSLPKVKFD